MYKLIPIKQILHIIISRDIMEMHFLKSEIEKT